MNCITKNTLPWLVCLTFFAPISLARAGHHHETELAKQHPEFDATDVYAFRSHEPDRTVFVLASNPKSQPGKRNFGTGGFYKFHLAVDKSLQAGITFTFSFGDLGHVTIGQSDSVRPRLEDGGTRIAEGEVNQTLELGNGIRVWTGTAEDPFFGNSAGLRAFMEQSADGKFEPKAFGNADNYFADKFVAGIVLEIPNRMLPEQVYYFGTTTKKFDDHWHQVNRIGHVLFSHLYFSEARFKDRQNQTLTMTDRGRIENATQTVTHFTKLAGNHDDPANYAASVVQRLLPDAVPYQIGSEAHYGVDKINGRRLSDDAMDTALTMLCGTTISDSVNDSGKHQARFPYVKPAGELLPISSYEDGPNKSTGLTVRIAASVDLAKEIPNADGRTLRMRHFTLAPGGKVAVHSHVDRPAVYYIISGVYTEYRSDVDGPRILYPGDFSPEWGGYSHWVHNRSTTQPLIFTSADVFNAHDQEKLDYETIRRNYGLNPEEPPMSR